jgi:hypothetical protein
MSSEWLIVINLTREPGRRTEIPAQGRVPSGDLEYVVAHPIPLVAEVDVLDLDLQSRTPR